MNTTINKLWNWLLACKKIISEWAKKTIQARNTRVRNTPKLKGGFFRNLIFGVGAVRKLLFPLAFFALIIALFFLMNPFHLDWSLNKIEKETSFVVEEIKKISDFTTATYYEEQLIEKKKDGYTMFIIPKTYVLSVVVRGTVKVGFNLQSMSPSDVSIGEDHTVTIRLPKVEMSDPIINPSDITIVYGGGNTLFTDEDKNELINDAKKKIKENAKAEGILEQATEQGKKEMTNLLNALGFEKVNVVVKSM